MQKMKKRVAADESGMRSRV